MSAPGGDRPASWRGLAIAVSDDRALVSSEGAGLLVSLIAAFERSALRNGGRLSPAVEQLRDVLAMVAVSPCGHADLGSGADEPALPGEQIGTEEAAALLGVTRRHALRLAESGDLGPMHKVAGRTLLHRPDVIAYATERNT